MKRLLLVVVFTTAAQAGFFTEAYGELPIRLRCTGTAWHYPHGPLSNANPRVVDGTSRYIELNPTLGSATVRTGVGKLRGKLHADHRHYDILLNLPEAQQSTHGQYMVAIINRESGHVEVSYTFGQRDWWKVASSKADFWASCRMLKLKF